jgi:hypothetical protein
VQIEAGKATDHVGVADRMRGRLVEARRVAQGSLDEMIEQRNRDVGEEQARNRLVDTAVLAQRAG